MRNPLPIVLLVFAMLTLAPFLIPRSSHEAPQQQIENALSDRPNCISTTVVVPQCTLQGDPVVYVVWHYPERGLAVGATCTGLVSMSHSPAQGRGIIRVWIDGEQVLEDRLPRASRTWYLDAEPGTRIVRVCVYYWRG